MKELLKVKHINDEICEVIVDLETEEHAMLLSNVLLGAMMKSQRLARAVIAAASIYVKNYHGQKQGPATDKTAS